MKLLCRISCACACVSGLLFAAQEAPVVLRATTRLVQISVVVQDKKGVPAADLKKEDFQIRDNGKPATDH